MKKNLIFSISKEWEFSYNFGSDFTTKRGKKFKTSDGSGPSEFSGLYYYSLKEIIFLESLLNRVYGNAIYLYYIRRDGDEEKGNHLHFKLNGDDKIFYEFYKHSTHFIRSEYNKLLTREWNWRNKFHSWIEEPYVNIDYYSFKNWSNGRREYTFITPNKQHKKNLTLEVRACEYSIVGDASWLVLVAGQFNSNKEYEYNLSYSFDIGGEIGYKTIEKLNFDYLQDSQREEFKEFASDVVYPYLKYGYTRNDLRIQGFKWAEEKLTTKEKNKIKRKLASALFS